MKKAGENFAQEVYSIAFLIPRQIDYEIQIKAAKAACHSADAL